MRRRVYTDDFRRAVVARVGRGEPVRDVARDACVPYNTAWRWCQEAGVSVRKPKPAPDPKARTELRVFVPSNREDETGMPTHVDGWNEILEPYKRNRYKGSKAELANVEYVASYVGEAMREQGWAPMTTKAAAVPCHVHLLFVERDRSRDIPNIHGGAKYAMDALTHRHQRGASAIYDDSQRWCVDVTYGVTCDPTSPGIQITVRAMEKR